MKRLAYIILVGMVSFGCTSTENTNYIFSYFTGNGEDGLHLAYSEDGLNWNEINGGEALISPLVGKDKLMRDPCIIQGGDGDFHMVWTVSWSEKGIGYAHSEDLVNWSEQLYIPVMEQEDSAVNCWAPEIFYDETQDLYMIYWATTILGKFPETENSNNKRNRNHRIYYVTTKDFKTFSETKLLYDQGFNVIDAVIIKEDEEYIMFLKDETLHPTAQKNIKIARSEYLSHGYGPPGEAISPDSVWVEGPTIIKRKNDWMIYFDQYRLGKMGAMTSKDLIHWTNISEKLSFPEGTRHGTVFEVPLEVLNNLKEKVIIARPEEEKTFNKLYDSAGEVLFFDDGTQDWTESWTLDGKIGYVENSKEGMALHAGPEVKNDAHNVVLWTKQSFYGDLLIEYDYTRLDSRNAQVNIIYIQATGCGEGEYSKDIFEWNELRVEPAMRCYYDNMNTLHISYAALSEDGDYIRARRYRPDFNNKMVGTDLGSQYNTGFFDTGIKHHITIIKKGFDLYMKVSNEEQTFLYKWNYKDHPEIVEGPIGLRHMTSRSSLYKNFTVKRMNIVD